MATQTTTIRVPVETRDRLNAQAQHRGISIAALINEWAAREEREAAFTAERAATRAESTNPDILAEDNDWGETDTDGID